MRTAPRSRPLRVVFGVRCDWQASPGGDSVQIANTARELEALGVEVAIHSRPDESLAGFDLMHLFHLSRVHESYPHLLAARRAGLPMVLSTIYWPERIARTPGERLLRGAREGAKNLVRSLRRGPAGGRHGALRAALTGYDRCRRQIARGARMLLPNSAAELERIRQEFGSHLPGRPVTNGIHAAVCRRALAGGPVPREPRLLCVGHFDPRKNQLCLIEALRDADVAVDFIGQERPLHRRYFARCRHRAGPRMRFLGALDRPAVLEAMRRSRTLICPSRYETPGLANLEAAAMGCSLALGDCPPVREYFGGDAAYFEPTDLRAMRAAALAALECPAPPALAERVLAERDWSVAARQTLAAYHEALAAADEPPPAPEPAARRESPAHTGR